MRVTEMQRSYLHEASVSYLSMHFGAKHAVMPSIIATMAKRTLPPQ